MNESFNNKIGCPMVQFTLNCRQGKRVSTFTFKLYLMTVELAQAYAQFILNPQLSVVKCESIFCENSSKIALLDQAAIMEVIAEAEVSSC